MFEATLNEDFWGDEDFTCNQCHITFTSRKGASEHAETKHHVRRLLIKDRAQVKVKAEPGDGCKAIDDIDKKMKEIKVEGGEAMSIVGPSTGEFIEEDETEEREGSEADSDTGSEPERYDREAQSHAHYQEKLGSDQEDDDDEEEEKEASFYPLFYFSLFYLSGGGNL